MRSVPNRNRIRTGFSWKQTGKLQRSKRVPRTSRKNRSPGLSPRRFSRKPSCQARLLNTQKGLLDEVYESTRSEIAKLPESFHREAIKTLLTEAKKEIPKGSIHCNARDAAAAKAVLTDKENSGFTLGEPVDIEGGIVVEGEGNELQIDYGYRTFMNKVWESGLKDASDILFG